MAGARSSASLQCGKAHVSRPTLSILSSLAPATTYVSTFSGISNLVMRVLTVSQAQRNINHFTLDQSHRIKMTLPETFDVDEFLGLLGSRKNLFNIRARQASGSLYVLDLAKCHNFLKKVSSNSSSSNGGLRSFIDQTLVKTDSWHKCVKEVDPSKNKTVCPYIFNTGWYLKTD